MKILVHDYSGHPFQVQLSRALAKMGFDVLHLYSASFQTPKGNLVKGKNDPDNFNIKSIKLSKPFEKYSFVKRFFQEREYGRLAIKEMADFKPDVVINSNIPLDPLEMVVDYSKNNGIKVIFWWQDVYSIAIKELLKEKIPVVGGTIGNIYMKKERKIIVNSNFVIGITNKFEEILNNWYLYDVAKNKYLTIPNWAPIDEITLEPKVNSWSEANGFSNTFNFLYTGTLSYKHNPEILVQLATFFADRPEVRVIVTSIGIGADYLVEKKKENPLLSNLVVLPFQDFDVYSKVLGSADALISVLEKDAGTYSVPSKVLSYLSSGTPILLAVPDTNLAATIIKQNNCGLVSDTDDIAGFIKNAEILYNDELMRKNMGTASREYAKENFDIDSISNKFKNVIVNL